jgi:DNA-binding NarL/FixJ family response regulator
MSDATEALSSTLEAAHEAAADRTHVTICLIGGRRIVRRAVRDYLEHNDFHVANVIPEIGDLADWLDEPQKAAQVMVLLLAGGPFSTFHQIRDALEHTQSAVPLVVLSEQASRGQIYTALRIGAKAYVNLDAAPEELFKAIRMASKNKVYLAPEATELLVRDVSAAVEPNQSTRLPTVELSKREIEVVQLLCEGLSSKEIARRLHISAKTVENHRYNIYRKCEVDSIAGLMRHAIQRGMVSI